MDAYCIYLRKSRADDARCDGEDPLIRHEAALLRLADEQRLPITQIYREIVSGDTIADRPEMTRLLREVAEGRWKGVLVVEIERLARGDSIDQGRVARAFLRSGTLIVTPSKTYHPDNEFDQEYFEFGLFFSRREYVAINRRLQRGRTASVREGKFVGSIPPYGYERYKLPLEKGFSLLPVEPDASVVRALFRLYAEGDALATIARTLNADPYPPARHGHWSPATLRGMLGNPVYLGKIRWNARPHIWRCEGGQSRKSRPQTQPEAWILADGRHEALVDASVWQAVQERLQSHRLCGQAPQSTPNRNAANPLAGLVVCGICGAKLQRRPHGKHGAPSLICPTPACPTVGAALVRVEHALFDTLHSHYEGASPFPPPHASSHDEKRPLQAAARKRLQDQFDALHDLLESGVYSPDAFAKRRAHLLERMKRLEEKSSAPLPLPAYPLALRNPIDLYTHTDDPACKRDYLALFLIKAVYRRPTRAAPFELDVYPRFHTDTIPLPDASDVPTNWPTGK